MTTLVAPDDRGAADDGRRREWKGGDLNMRKSEESGAGMAWGEGPRREEKLDQLCKELEECQLQELQRLQEAQTG
ncbi:hypothetical protein FS749_007637 [Ceratobasidium sp. UAMH 11750]|nr:hypothetical protein FS749_007637 [Ceratobasidium sp. UAMH 11750]